MADDFTARFAAAFGAGGTHDPSARFARAFGAAPEPEPQGMLAPAPGSALDAILQAPAPPGPDATPDQQTEYHTARANYDLTSRNRGRAVSRAKRETDANAAAYDARKEATDEARFAQAFAANQRLAGGGAAFAQMDQEQHGAEIPEPWSNVGRSMLGGLIQGGGSALSGMGEGSDAITRTLRRVASKVGVERAFDLMMAPSEALGITKGVRAAGQSVEDLGTKIDVQGEAKDRPQNIISNAVGQLGGQVILALTGGNEAAITAYLGQGFDQIADTVRAKGKEGTLGGDLATIAGAPITAITERYGLGKLLERAPPAVRNRVARGLADIAIAGGTEMSQEVAEQLGQNIAIKLGVDGKQDLTEGFGQSAIGGGGAGVVGRVALGMLGLHPHGHAAHAGEAAIGSVEQSVLRQPTASGLVETAAATPTATPDDAASPLPTDLIEQGRRRIATVEAKGKANEILSQNQAPKVGTEVALGGKRATIADAFTDDSGEAGITLRFASGQTQKVYLNDLADAGISLEPVPAPRDLLGEIGGLEQPSAPPQPTASKADPDAAIRFVMNTQEGGGKRTVDSGGVTRFGISQNAHPEVNVDRLTEAQAIDIYRRDYWDKLGLDNADPRFAVAALDTAINHGLPKAREMVADANGDVGKLIAIRQAEYDRLVSQNPVKYGRYEQGWRNRLDKLAEEVGAVGPAPVTSEGTATAPDGGSGTNFLTDPILPDSGDEHSFLDETPATQPDPTLATPAPAEPADLKGGDQSAAGEVQQEPVRSLEPTPTFAVENKQLVLRDITPDQRSAIDAALPGKARLVPRSDGAFVAPAKHEDSVRAVLGDGSPAAPVSVQTAADVARASERVAEPTEAQKESGNYRKAHVEVQGLPITIENPKGSIRSGVDPDGKPWSVEMPAAYGYVKRTVGQDQENVDIYVGDHPTAGTVYVVDQVHADSKAPDEHKVMLGFPSEQAALDTYHQAFSDGRGPDRVGAVTPMSVDEFKAWLKDGDTTKPVGGENVAQAAGGHPTTDAAIQAAASNAPMRNIVHERPAIQVGNIGENDHSTEEGFTYRTMSPAELGDAAARGEFLPNPTGRSKGGQKNAKHWVRGGAESGQFFRADQVGSGGSVLVRVPSDKVSPNTPVKFEDAQVVVTDAANKLGLTLSADDIRAAAAFHSDGHTAQSSIEQAVKDARVAVLNKLAAASKTGYEYAHAATALHESGRQDHRGAEEGRNGPDGVEGTESGSRSATEEPSGLAQPPEASSAELSGRGAPGELFSIANQPAPIAVTSRYANNTDSEARIFARRDALEHRGKVITNEATGRDIHLTTAGLKHATTGSRRARADYELARHIPDLVRTAEHVGSEPDTEGRNNIKAYHTYRAAAVVDGVPHTARVIVRETMDGHNFYDSHASEEGGPDVVAGRGANRSLPSPPGPAADIGESGPDEKHRVTTPEFASDAERNASAAAVRAELQKRGVEGKVALRTVELIHGDPRIAGRYHRGVIDVALQAAQSPTFTANHEVVHFVKETGRINKSEWTAMTRAALSDSDLMASIERRYPGLDRDGQIEEAIADMLAGHIDGTRPQKGLVRTALDRVVEFLRALGHALAGNGFSTSRGAMERFASGEIGRREPGGQAPTADEKLATVPADEPAQRAAPEAESEGSATPPLITMIENEGGGGGKPGGSDTFDKWRTALQDRMLPLLRTQQRIETVLGRELDEDENPYLAEELMTGKVGARLERLTDELVNPLFAAMKEEGVSAAELESYLYARHAPERNAQIAKINPEFSDGEGSGMTDIEAAAIIARARRDGRVEALDRVSARVDNILRFAVDTRVEAGLLSEEEAQAWRDTYQHYVPLRGHAEDQDSLNPERPRRGSGINVRGTESQRAFGRRSKADDILAHAIMQAEESIVRGEMNEVGQRFLELAKAAPDPEFWTIDKVRRVPVENKTTGQVSYRTESRVAAEDAPYTISVKVDGEEHRITLNRDNPAAVKLADAMRNLTGSELNAAVGFVGKFTRFFSAINTRFAPPFIITNAIRDIQTASVNLQQHGIPGLVRGVLKDWRKALVAPKTGDGEWAKWRREFELAGGKIYFNDIGDINTLKAKIERQVSLSNSPGAIRAAVTTFLEGIEMVNDHIENAVRLAAYKNAREAGLSRDRAASIARNATVNFTRRGKFGPAINSLYAFFNASTQGSATLITAAFRSRKVRGALFGLMAAGFLLDMLNALMGDDDDDGQSFWSKVSENDKERSLILMIPGEKGKMLKLPLGLGLNAFFNTGRVISEIMRGVRSPASGMGEALWGFADAFNPLGGGGSKLNYVLPTIFDPMAELAVNRNFAGKPIQPDQSPYDPPVTPSSNFTPNVNPIAKAFTDELNKATGGDEVQPGKASISPNVVQYLFGYFTGSAGRFVGDVASLPFRRDSTINDIPFANRVAGDKPVWYDKAAMYSRIDDIEQRLGYAKGYAKGGDAEGLQHFVGDNGIELRQLVPLAKWARKEMSEIRKARGAIDVAHDRGRLDDDAYKADKDQLDAVEQSVVLAFNKRYLQVAVKPVGLKP